MKHIFDLFVTFDDHITTVIDLFLNCKVDRVMQSSKEYLKRVSLGDFLQPNVRLLKNIFPILLKRIAKIL